VTTSPTPTAVVREVTSWDAFPALWPRLLDEVWAFVRGSGIDAGRNVMVYRDDRPAVEVGVEVPGTFAPSGRVVPSALPSGRAAHVVVRGPLSAESIESGHTAVLRFIEANALEATSVRFEVYGHVRGDPADYETWISWLLAPTGARMADRASSPRSTSEA
jgi:hypothetical protein